MKICGSGLTLPWLFLFQCHKLILTSIRLYYSIVWQSPPLFGILSTNYDIMNSHITLANSSTTAWYHVITIHLLFQQHFLTSLLFDVHLKVKFFVWFLAVDSFLRMFFECMLSFAYCVICRWQLWIYPSECLHGLGPSCPAFFWCSFNSVLVVD